VQTASKSAERLARWSTNIIAKYRMPIVSHWLVSSRHHLDGINALRRTGEWRRLVNWIAPCSRWQIAILYWIRKTELKILDMKDRSFRLKALKVYPSQSRFFRLKSF